MTIKNKQELFNALEGDHIDVDAMTIEELAVSFTYLNNQMLSLYNFVLSYSEYMNTRHDYTENEQLTTLDAHLLTDICDYPNSTVTSLAISWNRSVSATSQTVRKLIEKDLVKRKNSKIDGKVFYLLPTKKGLEVSNNHKRYDVLDIIKTLKTLKHDFTLDEVDKTFEILDKLQRIVSNF